MAELHIVGQITGATGFEDRGVFCKWGVVAGRMWELLEGLDRGQTHVDFAKDGDMAVWAHPLDIHFAVKVRTVVHAIINFASCNESVEFHLHTLPFSSLTHSHTGRYRLAQVLLPSVEPGLAWAK